MWMPRPCTWNDMIAASTPYAVLRARRAWQMSVSAGHRAPAARREPAAINSGQAELRCSRHSFTPRSAFRDIPGLAAARTDSEHAGTAATLGQVRAVAQFG